MFLSYLKSSIDKWFALNRINTSTWVVTFPAGQKYITLATAAIVRVQGGLKLTDAATGNPQPTAGAGNAMVQALSKTCYYVLTMTAADTAAYKLYKGVDGRDAFPDLGDAMDANEIPLGCLKIVTASTGSFAALTDLWDDAQISTITWCDFDNGYIEVDVPSALTFGSAV